MTALSYLLEYLSPEDRFLGNGHLADHANYDWVLTQKNLSFQFYDLDIENPLRRGTLAKIEPSLCQLLDRRAALSDGA